MTAIERYNLQTGKSNNGFSAADNALDKYILTMIETKDQRRLLLDSKEFENIKAVAAEDLSRYLKKQLAAIRSILNS